jgi:hypothetical protein
MLRQNAPTFEVKVKPLSTRVKLDAVDDYEYPVYSYLLGTNKRSVEEPAVIHVKGLIDPFLNGTATDQHLHALETELYKISTELDTLYNKWISPLALYVGTSGIVPEELQTKTYTGDQFIAEGFKANLSEEEKDNGTFFVLPNGVVISVYSRSVYFQLTQ